MRGFGDDDSGTTDYLTLHGLKHGTQTPELSDEKPYYFDSLLPFKPTQPNEDVHEAQYMGKIANGPFKNFNLFLANRDDKYFIIVFGRAIRLTMDSFEHLCDKEA